ncbi:MAG: T9SS type A sorting domain-containing protein [Bacteroidota bacterium]
MRQTLLAILYLFVLPFGLFAQTTLEPSTATAAVNPDAVDVVAHATVTNNGDKEESYRWKRTIIAITEGWETAVCDKNLCYNPDIDEAPMPFSLTPSTSDVLDVHVYPYGIAGTAHIELTLIKDGSGEEIAKSTYLFEMATNTLEVVRTKLLLYPNPTTNAFHLSSTVPVQALEVYNAIGKRVGRFNHQAGMQYDIANYPRGFYLVKIISPDQQVIGVKRLQKL